MRLLISASISFVLTFSLSAQKLTEIPLEIDWAQYGGGQITGNLADGSHLNDLSWAWSSSVACFPETQFKKFTGKHMLYSFEIPPRTQVEITVIPDNKKANMSLYAYMVGSGSEAIVPDLKSCIRCESDYKWDMPWRGKTQDHTRIVKNILAINQPYKVYIEVTAADGVTDESYTLRIKAVK